MRDKEKMIKNLKAFNPMALREKYSVSSNKQSSYSSFWLDEGWNNNTSIFDEDEPVKKGVDLIALASYRRAIANFVNIVTGKDIKVTFTSTGDSFTDGKVVTISSKLDDKLFDSTVGLALHEGSHIKLSDFEFLKQLEVNIPKEYIERGFVKGFNSNTVKVHIKNLLNYVEDRRIDYFIFSNSPGYKGYYHSMYNKYFHSKVVDKGLVSDDMRDENWDSYIFRILNLSNKNTKLNALEGLKDIWKTVDLKNISRLNSTEDAFNVALNIYDIILNNVPDGKEKTDKDTGEVSYERADGSGSTDASEKEIESGEAESKEMSDKEFDELLEAVEKGNVDFGSEGDDGNSSTSIETDSKSTKGKSTSSKSKSKSDKVLTEAQKKSLEKAIEKQKKFMEGDITKKKISKKDKAAMDAIDASGMSYKEVGKDLKDRYTGEKTKGTKCIVVKNLNKTLIESGTIDILRERYYTDEAQEIIDSGLRLGTILGKKLSIRTESRDTKYTRKDSGRIDKRLIAELGFDNNNVFSQTFVETYPDAHLHISVDASGSMSGDKMNKTMKSVTAMVKAIDMIEGVEVVVSFRSTQNSGTNYRSNEQYPIILIAYDSTKDNIVKVKTLWKHIRAGGTTPEGLCFEAVMNEMTVGGTHKESYFLNFSDGMPMFGNHETDYHNDTAITHTKSMVKKIKERGIGVLSYYIGSEDYGRESTIKDFKRMYGRDSQYIDVSSVTAVSRSMNKKFLEKKTK